VTLHLTPVGLRGRGRPRRDELKLSTAHRKFLRELEISGVSPLTLEAYGSDFHIFLTFVLRDRGQWDSLRSFTDKAMQDFLHWMHEQGYSNNSIARRINTLSSFGGWCKRWDYIKVNPCDKIRRPRKQRRVPPALTQAQTEQLLELVPTLSRLEQAVILTMFYTGCRRGEVLTRKEADYNADEATMYFERKGGDQAVVPLMPEVVAAVTDYLLARGPKEDPHLFLQENGRAITVKWLRQFFIRLTRRLGVARFTPHMMRHTFITYALRFGGKLEEVAEFVGHRDIETTRGYARVAFEQLVATAGRLRRLQGSVPE